MLVNLLFFVFMIYIQQCLALSLAHKPNSEPDSLLLDVVYRWRKAGNNFKYVKNVAVKAVVTAQHATFLNKLAAFEITGCCVSVAPDQGKKRKQDGSSSSQDSGVTQPSKKRRSSSVR